MSDCKKIKNLKVKSLVAETAKFCDLRAKDATIKNLNVCTINGRNPDCVQDFSNIVPNFQIVDYVGTVGASGASGPVDPFTPGAVPVQPPNTEGYNFNVWNALWENTVTQLSDPCLGLAARLQCGRLTQRYYQNLNGCVPCPDEWECCEPVLAPTGPTGCGSCLGINVCSVCPGGATGATGCTGNPCPSIPIRILSVESYPIATYTSCGSTGCATTVQQLLSSVAYNLDVFNATKSLGTRVVSVLVQIGYVDSNSVTQIVQVKFATKQVGVTLDTLYGENFTANVLISSDLTESIVDQMPQFFSNKAVAQIVIYVEQGLEIQILPPVSSRVSNVVESKISSRVSANTSGGLANAQYLGSATPGYTYTITTTPGSYPVFPGDSVLISGGGGGGGAGSYANQNTNPNDVQTTGSGGGGGGQGFTSGGDAPTGSTFFKLTSLGQGGKGGTGASSGLNGSSGLEGDNTTGYFTDASGNQLGPIFTSQGGNGGSFGGNGSAGGNGGNGLAGGGGGGGTVNGNTGGIGGTGPLGNGGSGFNPGVDSPINGGSGGNNGGNGGVGISIVEPDRVIVLGGGGGGAGFPFSPIINSTFTGAKGGNASENGFNWSGNTLPNVAYGVGGGGGGGGQAFGSGNSGNSGNGGDGAPGYLLIVHKV